MGNTQLEAIFNTVVDGIITIDEYGIIETVNPAAANIFGYDTTELVGQNISMLMPARHSDSHNQYIENYKTTGIAQIIGIGREVVGKQKSGEEFPFLLSISEVQLNDRKIFTGIIHDITKLRAAESALVENQRRLDAIIKTAVDGIIIINRRGIIEMTNPSVTRMFGYEKEEMIGHNIKMLMPEPHKSSHDGYIRNYQQTGHRKIIGIGREVEGKRKDGSTFPFSLSVSEVKLESGTVYTGVIHDISEQKNIQRRIKALNEELEKRVEERTEKLAEAVNKLLQLNRNLENEIRDRKATEEALRRSQEELKRALSKEQELNQLKSRFVSTASHEFRTPLSTILSSASLISRYTAPGTEDKRAKHVERIKSAVQNLTGILNDFLSISKLEEGGVEHQPELLDIVHVIHNIIDEMKGITRRGQVINYQHEGNQEVILDPRFIKNIVINLLSNAIKYSHENAEIVIKTIFKNNNLQLTVIDSGIGIPEEEQEHLFERFFRAKNAFNLQGTGLGLNIVKRYVDLMQGQISYQSKLNVGTTFEVLLPNQKLN